MPGQGHNDLTKHILGQYAISHKLIKAKGVLYDSIHSPLIGIAGAWRLFQLSRGERQGTSWTGDQGLHIETDNQLT